MNQKVGHISSFVPSWSIEIYPESDGLSSLQWYLGRRQHTLVPVLPAHYVQIGNKTLTNHLQKRAANMQKVRDSCPKKKDQKGTEEHRMQDSVNV